MGLESQKQFDLVLTSINYVLVELVCGKCLNPVDLVCAKCVPDDV